VNRSAGVLRVSVDGDASLDQITADDLGRDAHDNVVARLDARDLLIETPRSAGHAPRPHP
jgi:hypothetical protein